ncbi:MAG TPA: hypothetical protein PLQ09_09145 [Prolixibacteraceae bacterium]|nr:hypothetical protein [Bacteroidales bacterium]HQN94275.1 hypothetical protein [Prolixibacteraceae bacterium]
MDKRVTILLLGLLFLAGCSTSARLSKKYTGKGIEVLYREMGNPVNTVVLENGNRIFEYEKETFVRQTEISTGRGTLDPRISPSYSKVEIYLFEIDKEGVIVRTAYKKQIEK